ncbi:MAG: bifunctional adenosylcobinamide kinase/adenosylcobinamide-phosphate guanylyltransferase [bacterium]
MIELIAGGARSGKSSYALETAEAKPGNKIYVATATSGDAEMGERIARHKADRAPHWHLLEQPMYLAEVVKRYDSGDVLLIDCLTLWLSNWLCANKSDKWENEKSAFLESLRDSKSDILIVTNEVGLGVVPIGELSRDFVDHSGWLHQEIAVLADKVTLVMFGLQLSLKG